MNQFIQWRFPRQLSHKGERMPAFDKFVSYNEFWACQSAGDNRSLQPSRTIQPSNSDGLITLSFLTIVATLEKLHACQNEQRGQGSNTSFLACQGYALPVVELHGAVPVGGSAHHHRLPRLRGREHDPNRATAVPAAQSHAEKYHAPRAAARRIQSDRTWHGQCRKAVGEPSCVCGRPSPRNGHVDRGSHIFPSLLLTESS